MYAKKMPTGSFRLLNDRGVVIGSVFKNAVGWYSLVNSFGHRASRIPKQSAGDAAQARWGKRGRDAITHSETLASNIT